MCAGQAGCMTSLCHARYSKPCDSPSITPLVATCSLVKKDAGMLDAFGKGASEDIQLAKSELYSQMTWDKDTKSSLSSELQLTTPLPSPPPSPKPRKASAEDISKLQHQSSSIVCYCIMPLPLHSLWSPSPQYLIAGALGAHCCCL